jgi:hypothetical protein
MMIGVLIGWEREGELDFQVKELLGFETEDLLLHIEGFRDTQLVKIN